MTVGDQSGVFQRTPEDFLKVLPEFRRRLQRKQLSFRWAFVGASTGILLAVLLIDVSMFTDAVPSEVLLPLKIAIAVLLGVRYLSNGRWLLGLPVKAKKVSAENLKIKLSDACLAERILAGQLLMWTWKSIYRWSGPPRKKDPRQTALRYLEHVLRGLGMYLVPWQEFDPKSLRKKEWKVIAALALLALVAISAASLAVVELVTRTQGYHLSFLLLLGGVLLLVLSPNIICIVADNCLKGQQFADYLEDQWREDCEYPHDWSIAHGDFPSLRNEHHSFYMHLLLNEFENRFTVTPLSGVTTPQTILVMPSFIVLGLFWLWQPQGAVILALTWLVEVIVFNWLQEAVVAREVRAIHDQTAQSNILIKLADGEPSAKLFYSFIPWPFSSTLQRREQFAEHGESFQRNLARVILNLDWYVGSPRRLLRISWIWGALLTLNMMIIVAAVGFTAAGWIPFLPAQEPASYVVLGSASMLLLLISLLPVNLRQKRVALWRDEVLRQLRGSLRS